ncbi:MAG: HPP family protein [Pseudomonas sp.]|nr:HPP family protein [Pseudomonas sp.]
MRAQWIKAVTPLSLNIPKKQWIKSASGAFIGVLSCMLCGHFLFGSQITLSLAAPIGASAILLFVTPATPLAHPWSLLAGNLLAACIGLLCALYIDEPALRAAVAVGLAIVSMLALRCLHPPSCALALTVALSASLHELGFALLIPIIGQSLLLLGIALVFNNLSGSAYPRVAPPLQENLYNTADPLPISRTGFNEDDLDQALSGFGTYLDIRREDLEALLRLTEQHSFKRRTGHLTAASIMSRDLRTGHPEMPIEEAWIRLKEHRLKALPIVDQHRRLVGIITLVDLLKYFELDAPISRFHRLRYLRNKRLKHIMTTPVISVHFDTSLIELVTLLSDRGLHYIPVIDQHRQLAGIITQTDLIAALYRGGLAGT